MTDEESARQAGDDVPDHPEPDPNAGSGTRWIVLFAWVVGVLSLFGPLGASGIWDPHELKVADLARRIGVSLLGARELALEGANNAVPTLSELGRGELPFTSVALGFKLFGLAEWAGRLPLAVWGLLGLGACYALVSRFLDRRAAALSLCVLSTTPLFFVQSRTILGDVVTMSAHAIATAGLAIAAFDRNAGPRARIAWLVLGVLGCLAGFGARGVLLGAAVPSLGVGLAWAVLRSNGARGPGPWAGWAILAGGLAAAAVGAYALIAAPEEGVSRLLGTALAPPRKLPTHDYVVHQLGHGLFPWSALIPFAFGRLLSAPSAADSGAAFDEAALRLTLLLVGTVGLAAYGFSVPLLGVVPFGPVFALAAAVAVLFRDIERGAPLARTLAIGVAALAVLFYTDFKNFPEKGLAPFVVEGASFPESFKLRATAFVKYATVATLGLFFFACAERSAPGQRVFERQAYGNMARGLRKAFGGNLLFTAVLIEVLLVAFAGAVYLSDTRFHFEKIQAMGAPLRQFAKVGFLVLPLAAVGPWAASAARDAFRVFFRRVALSRGVFALLSVVALGSGMSFWYYPALAAQLSPKEIFESYSAFATKGEDLGILGQGSGIASYYAGKEVRVVATAHEAFGWLSEPGAGRRWLIVRAQDLGQLNSSYRGKYRRNLPVLDGRSSELLLVSSALEAGEVNQNPLSKWLPRERPIPSRKMDVDFGGQLRCLGWDVTDLDGRPIKAVRASKRYHFRLYYEVEKAISGDWKTFIHIDGYQRRYNGDHDTLEGKYPFHLWKPGDFVVDVHEFELEPNFTTGAYEVYFGLFRGNRRLEVKRGPHAEDRVHGGRLEVL